MQCCRRQTHSAIVAWNVAEVELASTPATLRANIAKVTVQFSDCAQYCSQCRIVRPVLTLEASANTFFTAFSISTSTFRCLWTLKLFGRELSSHSEDRKQTKKLSQYNALRARVYIYIRQLSSFRAPTLCLSIWLSLLAIFNTLFWVYANIFHEKTDKTRKYSKAAISVSYEMPSPRATGRAKH